MKWRIAINGPLLFLIASGGENFKATGRGNLLRSLINGNPSLSVLISHRKTIPSWTLEERDKISRCVVVLLSISSEVGEVYRAAATLLHRAR